MQIATHPENFSFKTYKKPLPAVGMTVAHNNLTVHPIGLESTD
jgi:hypothetical protein